MHITANDHLRRVFIATLMIMIALAGLLATPVRAAEVQVDTVDELIAAITAANASGEPTVIVLSEGGDYVLATADNEHDGANGLPVITGNVTIHGNGATIRRIILNETPEFRLFYVAPGGRLVLEGVTVRGCYALRRDHTIAFKV
jgi:hypothetical protein